MNKSNIIKVFIAVLLIAIVAVATFNYGATQRKKVASNDPTKSSLPSVKDDSANQPAIDKPRDTQGIDTPSDAPVEAKLPSQNIPATGPADNLVAVIALGTLTGLYLVSRRKLKQVR
jgi:hypothetical protein